MLPIPSKISSSINKFISIWIIFALALLILYFVWAFNRGFEISDESYYLLLAINSSSVKLFVSAQHWVTSGLWAITGNLIGFRAIGFSIIFFAAVILGNGAINAYTVIETINKLQSKETAVILASTLAGALLYGATINFSPSYNLLAAASAYIAMGAVLLSIGEMPIKRKLALHILAGCALGITLLNKFSAGLATVALTGALSFFWGRTLTEKATQILMLFGGVIVCMLVFMTPYSKTANILDEFQFGMAVFKLVQFEPNTTRIARYTHEFLVQIFKSGMLFIIPIAYLSTYIKSYRITHYINIIMLCIMVLNYIYSPKTFTLYEWGGVSLSLTGILALSLVLTIPAWTENINSLILAIGLLILPYCVAFGTGNSIHTQIVDSLASWGTLIAVLAVSKKNEEKQVNLVMLLCALFISTIVVRTGLSGLNPYHLNSPIWKQTIPTEIGEIGTVKVDKATHEFVLALIAAKKNCNISPDQPYLGFYHMPGVALVIPAIPVLSPWLSIPNQSELLLSKARPEILQSAIIGIRLNPDGTFPQLPKQLKTFPAGYISCGEATYPFANQQVQLWAPHTGMK